MNDQRSNEVNPTIQRPFLKWVGGKTQIIYDILEKIPTEINNYHELFLGGGSVLLAVLSYQKLNKIQIQNNIYAYDLNEGLINTFKNIQKNKDQLFEVLIKLRSEYNSLDGEIINRSPRNLSEAKSSKESYYYWSRDKFNNITDTSSIEYSALFIFLNKTCFRGMYREGPNGFNVPYGHYKKTPIMLSKEDLDNIHYLIKNVIFIKSDFRDSIKSVIEGDFVYLDPPYAPVNTKSFVGYTPSGFDLKTHKILFENIKNLNKNVKFVMSNNKVDLVTDHFNEFTIDEIITRHSINSKKPETTATEVIIYN